VEEFLQWFERSRSELRNLGPLASRGVCATSWFITLAPFDDGTAPDARAYDMAWPRAMARQFASTPCRQYSEDRSAITGFLNTVRKADGTSPAWLEWFLTNSAERLEQALLRIGSRAGQDTVSGKSHRADGLLSTDQVLNRLLDGGENGFRTDHAAQYQAVAKVSSDRHAAPTTCLEQGMF